MQIPTDIPGTLKRIREAYNFTQAFIAEFLEIDVTSYGRYEKGTTDIKLTDFLKLAYFYGKSPENIFRDFPPNGEKPVIINPTLFYEERMLEADSKIIGLEKEKEHLTNQVSTLKDLVNTKQKYLELLEQKMQPPGEVNSPDIWARHVGT